MASPQAVDSHQTPDKLPKAPVPVDPSRTAATH